MKNLIVLCNIDDVFCDINDKDNEKLIKKFINLLEEKRIENACNKITICLLTETDNKDYLKKYYDYFKNNVDNYRTAMGIQYYKTGGIIDGVINDFGEDNDLFEFLNAACSSEMYSAFEPVTSILFIGSKPSNDIIKRYYENNKEQQNQNANYEYYSVSVNNKKVKLNDVVEELKKSMKHNTYDFNEIEERENVLVFFSDIDGTIDRIDENSVREFEEVLEAKRVGVGADKIILSLVSNCDNVQYLKVYADMLNRFFTSGNIIVDGHFYRCGMLIGDNDTVPTESVIIPTGDFKADKIIYLIKKLFKKYNIKHVCYADDLFDNECYLLLSNLFVDNSFDIEFYSSSFYVDIKEDNVKGFEGNIRGLIRSLNKNICNYADNNIKNNNGITYKIGKKDTYDNK